MTTAELTRSHLESPVFKAIARAGRITDEELEYQLAKCDLTLEAVQSDAAGLVEEGHVRHDGHAYEVVIPARGERPMKGSNPDWDDEEILDRIRLWALVTGRPPAQANLQPARLRSQAARLRVRQEQHERVAQLYEAGDWPSAKMIRDRFGSLNAALVTAGFAPRGRGRQPGIPVVPGIPARRTERPGPDSLAAAVDRVTEARAAEDETDLHDALVELAMAAFNEADRLEKWNPDPEET